jgi:hypothetical protein
MRTLPLEEDKSVIGFLFYFIFIPFAMCLDSSLEDWILE